jgi:tripartite-type tricarboxylate transporter receptor subunit TctC
MIDGGIAMLSRRIFLASIALFAPPVRSPVAGPQTYPTRPVRLIVGFTPGSAPDIVARLMGQWLSERVGQPFIVENRPGAGTNIGTEVVVRAPPDGYTLLVVGAPNAINATLYEKSLSSDVHGGMSSVSLQAEANAVLRLRLRGRRLSVSRLD